MRFLAVLLALAFPYCILASTCGEAAIPFSFEVLQNGLPVLGCARPTCFGWTADGRPSGTVSTFSNYTDRVDGFFRVDKDTPKSSIDTQNFVPQTARCSAAFDSEQCPNPNQWVGGIQPLPNAKEFQFRLQCCEYEPTKLSEDRGIAYLTAGHIVIGGEVSEGSFDYISNVVKNIASDGTVSYNVSIHRMPCVPQSDASFVQENLQTLGGEKKTAARAFQSPLYNPGAVLQQEANYLQQGAANLGQNVAPAGGYNYPAAAAPAYYPVAAPQGGMFCFSADTKVTLQSGIKKRMDELKIGDWVLAGNKNVIAYSRVDSWLHKMPETMADFIHFILVDGNELKITNKHYIFRGDCIEAGKSVSIDRLNADMVYAEEVTKDQCLFLKKDGIDFVETRIAKIEIVKEKGIYAPMTHSGNIVANNVYASCFNIFNDKTVQDTFSGLLKKFANSMWADYWADRSSNDVNEIEVIPGMSVLVDLLQHVVPSKY